MGSREAEADSIPKRFSIKLKGKEDCSGKTRVVMTFVSVPVPCRHSSPQVPARETGGQPEVELAGGSQ